MTGIDHPFSPDTQGVVPQYPRVLCITPCAFNGVSGGGVTFTNLFRGWPKDRLATVTGDRVPVSREVCGRYYFLTARELDFAFPFRLLYPYPHPDRTASGPADPETPSPPGLLDPLKPLARRVLGEGGIPDVGRLSPALQAWITEFKPDIVYTILGSPGYASLVEAVVATFHLPLTVHFMDEGVTDPRRPGLFVPAIRQVYRRQVRRLTRRARCAMAICQEMAETYAARYGRPFLSFQNTVDVDFVEACRPAEREASGPPVLVYAGSILPHSQRQSLMDCCQAVKALNESGFPVRLQVITPLSGDLHGGQEFAVHPMISVVDAPADDARFFGLLKSADALLLPVNFDPVSVHFIRLSMPTKVPAYLACGLPVLAYGPGNTAQIRYAREVGWGLVVEHQDSQALADAMRRCLEDRDLRDRLVANARRAARKNHHVTEVRARFREALGQAAVQPDTRKPDQPLPQTSLALRSRLDFIREVLATTPHDRILDIGCGSGDHLTAPLARRCPGARITGVEPDVQTLEHARRTHAACPNLRFLEALPPGEQFEVVIASEVLEHVQEPGEFLTMLWERLTPDGMLLLTVPNGYGCSEMMAVLEVISIRLGVWPFLKRLKHALCGGKPAPAAPDTLAVSPHVNFFTEKRLLALLRAAGFEPIRRQGRMVLHNFVCSNLIDASEGLAEANAWLGRRVPLGLAADWMFALRRVDRRPTADVSYRRTLYERLKGRLHRWGAGGPTAKPRPGR